MSGVGRGGAGCGEHLSDKKTFSNLDESLIKEIGRNQVTNDIIVLVSTKKDGQTAGHIQY